VIAKERFLITPHCARQRQAVNKQYGAARSPIAVKKSATPSRVFILA
jgi:hypothetical protein